MTDFAVTWDYRCPFARNAHEHVVAGLRAGAGWNVRFVPFSLGQVHVAEGDPDVWDRPEVDRGLLAPAGPGWSGPVRRPVPRRPRGALRPPPRRGQAPGGRGRGAPGAGRTTTSTPTRCSPRSPAARPSSRCGSSTRPRPRTTLPGVPTFMQGDRAVFVRLMHRPRATVSWHAHDREGSWTCRPVPRAQRVQAHNAEALEGRAPSPRHRRSVYGARPRGRQAGQPTTATSSPSSPAAGWASNIRTSSSRSATSLDDTSSRCPSSPALVDDGQGLADHLVERTGLGHATHHTGRSGSYVDMAPVLRSAAGPLQAAAGRGAASGEPPAS